MKPQRIKEHLWDFCKEFVDQRKQQIENNIARIEDSLKTEGKSTAGDKHHTGRAMLQLDRENVGKQLLEIEKQEATLAKIDIQRKTSPIALGNYIMTTWGAFFMGISAGPVIINETKIYCISPESPIGRLLLGKTAGDQFEFQGQEVTILEVY